MTDTKGTVARQSKLVAREKGEPIRGRTRYHISEECSSLRDNPSMVLQSVTDEIVDLLGLKLCSVCEKRESGGPAIDVLEGFFGEDYPFIDTSHELPRDMALALVDYLKERHFFIAHRKPKASVTE